MNAFDFRTNREQVPSRGWPVAGILLGAAAFLAALLFAPAGEAIFLPGDNRLPLLNAGRMLHGQVIYKDFFQFAPPGTELVYRELFRWFGARAWIPNATMLLLALSLVWLSISLSRKVMSGWAVFLPGTLLLTISLDHGLDPSHQWFSMLAVVAAAACLMEKRSPARIAVAGALCGFASFFTLPRGLLSVLGFAAFLLWEHRRRTPNRPGLMRSEARLAASFVCTVLVTNAYFVWRAGLGRFLASTVVFVIRYYPADRAANTFRTYLAAPPALRPWYGLPWVGAYLLVHVLVPGVYVLFAVRYRREARRRPHDPWERLMLINVTGVALFLSVAPAPSYFRLCVVSLPALILLAWLLAFPARLEGMLNRLLWVFALLMAVIDVQQVQRHLSPPLDLPAGRAAFREPAFYEQYAWLRDHTRPGEDFFEAGWANTYAALGLRNPAPVPFVTPTGYTRPADVREVVEALEARKVRLVLWSLDLDTRQTDPAADPLGPLRADLRTHYQMVKTFSNGDQVWRRQP